MRTSITILTFLLTLACNSKPKAQAITIPDEYVNTVFEPIAYKLASGKRPNTEEIDSFTRKPEYRRDFYYLLVGYDMENLFPKRYNNFEMAAESHMVNWLKFPTELDTIPSKIELISKELIQDSDTTFTYYVFKFKTEPPHWAAKDGWMIGCVGPYKKSDISYAWARGTFSRFNSIDSISTKDEAKWCHEHIYRNKD